MAAPKQSSLGTRLQMDFLTYTTKEHNKRETSVVGRSGCGLINMKCVGEGANAAKNSGNFLACSAVVNKSKRKNHF